MKWTTKVKRKVKRFLGWRKYQPTKQELLLRVIDNSKFSTIPRESGAYKVLSSCGDTGLKNENTNS